MRAQVPRILAQEDRDLSPGVGNITTWPDGRAHVGLAPDQITLMNGTDWAVIVAFWRRLPHGDGATPTQRSIDRQDHLPIDALARRFSVRNFDEFAQAKILCKDLRVHLRDPEWEGQRRRILVGQMGLGEDEFALLTLLRHHLPANPLYHLQPALSSFLRLTMKHHLAWYRATLTDPVAAVLGPEIAALQLHLDSVLEFVSPVGSPGAR